MLNAYQSQQDRFFHYLFIFKNVVKVTMQPEQAHLHLIEHVWFAQEEATVILTLPTVAFSAQQDKQQPTKEAPIALIVKVVK